MVVKIHEMVSDSSRHQISAGHGRIQSFNTEPPPHSGIHEQNHEKILELSNQIIRLLTGEVPIRCEDVTVYLSMEEWEYVERHKELYEDVMMEDHQPVITPDKSVWGEFHVPVSLWDIGCENGSEILSDNVEKDLNKTRKGQAESATSTERESLASEERHVPEKEIYPITKPTEYSPPDIKEEPASCVKGNLTDSDMYEPPEHTQTQYTSTYTGAESKSHGEGDISHPDISPLPEHTQSEYPSTDIKEESPTYGEGNLTDSDMYEPPEHTQTEYPSTDIKEESPTHGEGNLTDSDMYEPPEHTQTQYTSTDIKQELDSCDEGNLSDTDMYESPEIIKIKYSPSYTGAEPDSDEGDISHPDISPLPEHANTEYLHIVKEELPSCEEGNLTDSDMYEPPEHTQTECSADNNGEYVKSNPNPVEINQSESLIGSRKPDHRIYYTDPLTRNSVYKGHSAPSSDMGKVSCSESDHVTHGTNRGEGAFSSTFYGENSTPESTLKHQHIRTEGQPFSYSESEKHGTDSIAPKKQMGIHGRRRQFKCPECDKCFTSTSNLSRHKVIHTGEKPYTCSECGKCFTSASNLAKHMLIHKGEKPFKCAECEKCFTQASDLTRHRMVHTGIKPYKCPHCLKGFTQASNLARHKMIHASE
uniref:C2H2-type domain-containing protein n=1 Tax=Leptobrachium leishanense TaxID=445787 RepID=A0A8C5WEM8_9ANUR